MDEEKKEKTRRGNGNVPCVEHRENHRCRVRDLLPRDERCAFTLYAKNTKIVCKRISNKSIMHRSPAIRKRGWRDDDVISGKLGKVIWQ